MGWRIWGGAGLALAVLAGTALYLARQPEPEGRPVDLPAPAAEAPRFVGAAVCAECHRNEARSWGHSHHALAMQEASDRTVLGDFGDVTFRHASTITRFFRRDGQYFIRTDGPDGRPGEFRVRYTFGVEPLQQYLLELPGGRLQAFGIAWDTRPRDQGGQRWFSLYPDERLEPGDPLHWTGRDQNWNFMCAACHSTGVRKNYDAARDEYGTEWAEINVACEACHGPGSAHVTWARTSRGAESGTDASSLGLVVDLRAAGPGQWHMAEGQDIALKVGGAPAEGAMDTCFACHSRRQPLIEPATPGDRFLDNALPMLLEPGLYHVDGQILDEVFEYGSFLQSRMYQAGVTCTNCHEPHSLRLRAEGNALCAQCHRRTAYDTVEHTRHASGSDGSRCVDCHMPSKTYMQVDVRHDHGFRIPRPDLTIAYGVPNACNQCHTDRSPEWAERTITAWHGNTWKARPHFAAAMAAAQKRDAGAGELLSAVAMDPAQPDIVRASALSRLSGRAVSEAVRAGLKDDSALVRMAALRALQSAMPHERVALAAPLLSDPVRAVRVEAARLSAAVPAESLSPRERAAYHRAMEELIVFHRASADRPEAQVSLAAVYADLGQVDLALAALETALRLDPRFVPALVNLADLHRSLGQDARAEMLLRQAMDFAPAAPEPPHLLGLILARQQRMPEALELLGRAARLGPDVPRFQYVYGIALHSAGRVSEAVTVLERAHERAPNDWDVLLALATIERDRGRRKVAAAHARKLLALAPQDATAQALVRELSGTPD